MNGGLAKRLSSLKGVYTKVKFMISFLDMMGHPRPKTNAGVDDLG